jgi:hypothetical protein
VFLMFNFLTVFCFITVLVGWSYQLTSLSFFIDYNSDSQPGVRIPLGVRKQITGGTQKDYMCRISYLGIHKEGTILNWGYAEGYNSYLGARKGVQFQFGGRRVPKG